MNNLSNRELQQMLSKSLQVLFRLIHIISIPLPKSIPVKSNLLVMILVGEFNLHTST